MKSLTLPLAALVLTLSVAATAQHSRTTTHEGARGSATHTVTHGNGVRQADTTVTRAHDGATATGSRTRTRTETGSALRVDQTGFNGATRSVDASRNRATGQSTRTVTRQRRPR